MEVYIYRNLRKLIYHAIVYAYVFSHWPSVAQSWIARDRKSFMAFQCDRIRGTTEWMRSCSCVSTGLQTRYTLQWRYSFSRAEVTLIRSWTPIQQLVYHMLRYVAKQQSFVNGRMMIRWYVHYHIKTLMLWACERKSRQFGGNRIAFLFSVRIFLRHIDEVDRKENVSSLFHTRVEFIRLHHEGVKTHSTQLKLYENSH